jgi:hypothetical protein
MIRLFDISNGKVIPSEHCYTLKFLKDIMDEHPDDHIQIYSYLFYMTCPNPDMNPFFDIPEEDKEHEREETKNRENPTNDDCSRCHAVSTLWRVRRADVITSDVAKN